MTVNGYLFAGYALIWSLLFFYLVFMHRRQGRINRQLEDLAKLARTREPVVPRGEQVQ